MEDPQLDSFSCKHKLEDSKYLVYPQLPGFLAAVKLDDLLSFPGTHTLLQPPSRSGLSFCHPHFSL